MSGKLVSLILIGLAAVAGAAMYYLQVHAFYETLDPAAVTIELTPLDGEPVAVEAQVLSAIDASSSPLRFRACLTVDDPAALAGRFQAAADPVPLTAPDWFDCFDAAAIGAALEAGRAAAYLGRHEIRPGVDSIVAVFPDGRAYAWHQLNDTLDD